MSSFHITLEGVYCRTGPFFFFGKCFFQRGCKQCPYGAETYVIIYNFYFKIRCRGVKIFWIRRIIQNRINSALQPVGVCVRGSGFVFNI